jgi:hypothetical protein
LSPAAGLDFSGWSLFERAAQRTQSHTYKDIKADRTRLVKDLKVRHNDIVKLSKSPRRT